MQSCLSNAAILEQKKKGNIIIEPYLERNLANSSYDVSLGTYYYRQASYGKKSMRLDRNLQIYNIYDEADVKHMWQGAFEAERVKDFSNKWRIKLKNVHPDDRIILIYPHETILAHTNEFIGGRTNVTTMMKARSSIGRNFIEVCKCAGWGDVGYVNRWTMEITNNNNNFAIPLVVGRRIAQIIFFATDPVLGTNDYIGQEDSKYSSSYDVEELQALWEPSAMLPKMWKDREVRDLLTQDPKKGHATKKPVKTKTRKTIATALGR
jgi:dCTP deaminase